MIEDHPPYEGPDVISKLVDQTRPSCRRPQYLELPPERTGLLFVFRVFDRVAYAIVLEYQRADRRRRRRPQTLARRQPMDVDGRVEAWAFLQLVPGLSTDALVTLLKTFGGPVAVRDASRASLSRCVSGPVATAIGKGPESGTA